MFLPQLLRDPRMSATRERSCRTHGHGVGSTGHITPGFNHHFSADAVFSRAGSPSARTMPRLMIFTKHTTNTVVQPLSCVWLHGLQHARFPSPSLSPRVCSSLCPLSLWCHPTISTSVIPFSSCLQSFLASGSFPMSWLFTSGQSIETHLLALFHLKRNLYENKCEMLIFKSFASLRAVCCVLILSVVSDSLQSRGL